MAKVIIKTKRFDLPMYGDNITFIYSNSYDAIIEFAKKDGLNKPDLKYLEARDYEGYHFPILDENVKEYYLIVLKDTDKYKEVNTITHEILHLVVDILSNSGTKFNSKTEETYAYLVGYLNEEFFKFKDGKQ